MKEIPDNPGVANNSAPSTANKVGNAILPLVIMVAGGLLAIIGILQGSPDLSLVEDPSFYEQYKVLILSGGGVALIGFGFWLITRNQEESQAKRDRKRIEKQRKAQQKNAR